MKKLLLAATAVAGLAFAGTANAAFINADFGFNPSGLSAVTGSTLSQATSISWSGGNSYFLQIASGANAPANGAGITTLTQPISIALDSAEYTKTWTDGTTLFTEVFHLTSIDRSTADSLTFFGLGTVSGAGYDDTPIKFSAALSKSGTNIAGSFTDSTTDARIPEPATIALLGVGLLGLGLVRRRA